MTTIRNRNPMEPLARVATAAGVTSRDPGKTAAENFNAMCDAVLALVSAPAPFDADDLARAKEAAKLLRRGSP